MASAHASIAAQGSSRPADAGAARPRRRAGSRRPACLRKSKCQPPAARAAPGCTHEALRRRARASRAPGWSSASIGHRSRAPCARRSIVQRVARRLGARAPGGSGRCGNRRRASAGRRGCARACFGRAPAPASGQRRAALAPLHGEDLRIDRRQPLLGPARRSRAAAAAPAWRAPRRTAPTRWLSSRWAMRASVSKASRSCASSTRASSAQPAAVRASQSARGARYRAEQAHGRILARGLLTRQSLA